uniref:Uncharacterized protein n=1 Tax=viral metagenome TaxID=1070528 RepID=A0A6M3IV49_9ZZZZ
MPKVKYQVIIDAMKKYVDFETFNIDVKDLTTNIKKIIDNVNTKFNLLVVLEASGDAFSTLNQLIQDLIIIIEKVQNEMGGFDNDKKKALIKFLDDQIDLPFFFEWVDNKVIAQAIDAAVSYLNDEYGHNWDILTGDIKKQ